MSIDKIKFGILREGKVPPDKRVPFTPGQCAQILKNFSNVELVVQPSSVALSLMKCTSKQELHFKKI